jgi:Holliday junction DNA helicase RuvB
MRNFTDFIGNREAVQRIEILAEAAKLKGDRLAHIGLFGPSGDGKTSLARVTAKYLGAELVYINSVAVKNGLQFRKLIIDRLGSTIPTIVFLDECHRLPRNIQDHMLSMLEEPAVLVTEYGDDFLRDELPKKMSFILATTHAGELQDALLTRLERISLKGYSLIEKCEIAIKYLLHDKKIAGEKINPQALREIARRSRNIRGLIHSCDNVVRYADVVKKDGVVDIAAVDGAFGLEGIDTNGLTEHDRAILKYLNHAGQAGLNTLEAVLGISKREIQDKIEPWLLRNRFIMRRSAGRVITERGRQAAEGAKIDVF